MSSLHESRPHRPAGQIGPKAPARVVTILPEADHRQLQHRLALCRASRPTVSVLLAHVLSHKLATTRPGRSLPPADLVTLGCRVTYALGGGAVQSGRLVADDAGTTGGAIALTSLLGATLIGMKAGQRAPLLREDGSVGTVLVLDVIRPA